MAFTIDAAVLSNRKIRILYDGLLAYFSPERVILQLIPFIDEKKVSGRVCDYLVTTYSKKYFCPLKEMDVRQLYNITLRESGGRCFFDPFCRISSGIPVRFRPPRDSDAPLRTTTVAQMNFVRWYYTHGVCEFVSRNKQLISTDMQLTYRRIKSENKSLQLSGVKRKRKALVGHEGHATIFVGKKTVVLLE